MTDGHSVVSPADRTAGSSDDLALEARILVEYGELPGLSLTLPQAARLFDVEMGRCAHLLEDLVHDGRLWTNGHDFLSTGRGWGRRATLDQTITTRTGARYSPCERRRRS